MLQLTYIFHSCFALETDNCILIFDYWLDTCNVMNRFITTKKRVYAFASHFHEDHFTRDIFKWREDGLNVTYILSKDILKHRRANKEDADVWLAKGGTWEDENIKVENTVKDNNENSIPSEVTEQKPEQTTTPQTQQIKVSQIKLSAISTKIAAGKKIKLTADITKNASNKTLKWITSNSKVATVDKNGVVTIKKKAGGKTVKITAEATDGSGKKATFTIKVMKGVVKKVKISGKKTVKAGKTLKLKAKVTASKGANKKLKWTSSNPKYATVSASGKVKASKAGKKKSVKITAMATDGSGKKATVKIKIK